MRRSSGAGMAVSWPVARCAEVNPLPKNNVFNGD
jgi:hypothetical protein